MDLGCIDMGCLSDSEKQRTEPSSSSSSSESKESEASSEKKGVKESGHSAGNALNRLTSQIKKPSYRKGSPLNWFPRKKVDSYLKRKIKRLQDLGGMSSTLDETLGDSNPHYTRVEREKIAAKEAAQKAMDARKAALIEASWCRILQAARIQCKEAEALLLEAEKSSAEAFEAATSLGVIMYDIPDCSRKPGEVETSSTNAGGSTTHTVTASFETAFEVDKEVASAVKTALIKLANSSSFSKDEYDVLLRKINQNPELDEQLSDFTSECEPGPEVEQGVDELGDLDLSSAKEKQRKCTKDQFSENFNMRKLVDVMLGRMKCLQEEDLVSIATIVATRGLSAALAELENVKEKDESSNTDLNGCQRPKFIRRMSSVGDRTTKTSKFQSDVQSRTRQADTNIPTLDKYLVKRMSRLEQEVLEAKKIKLDVCKRETDTENLKNSSTEAGEPTAATSKVLQDTKNSRNVSTELPSLDKYLVKHMSKLEQEVLEAKKANVVIEVQKEEVKNLQKSTSPTEISSCETVQDLGSVLIKDSSKLEKDIEENKRRWGTSSELDGKRLERKRKGRNQDVSEIPSLDKFLVKHVSRLEREVQEAKNRNSMDVSENSKVACHVKNKFAYSSSQDKGQEVKENQDLNRNFEDEEVGSNDNIKSLDEILVKPVHRLDQEKLQAVSSGRYYGPRGHKREAEGNWGTGCESLDKVLVKHVSRLEREKLRCSNPKGEDSVYVKKHIGVQLEKDEAGLDQILVKRKSRLEMEKNAAAQEPEGQFKYSISRREAREKELQAAWGGISLGNSIQPRLSKLERDKAAWMEAEEEQKRLSNCE